MIITIKQIIDMDNLVGHIILNAIPASNKTIFNKIQEKGSAEIKVTVEDEEIDFESFVDHWQSQVNRMIKEKAVELMSEKCEPIFDQMSEMQDSIQDLIKEIGDDSTHLSEKV